MEKNTIVIANPFSKITNRNEDVIKEGNFGAVLAEAGIGKTALLVQLGLSTLLRDKNVLHISLNDPVTKVCLYYKEVFDNIAGQNPSRGAASIWEALLPHRFIMTFKVEGFSVPKLEERLMDLTEQSIFSPNLIIIDGLPFDETAAPSLMALKKMAREKKFSVWFTVTTHRKEENRDQKLPAQIAPFADLFEVILQLTPREKETHVFPLKGGTEPGDPPVLIFDPSTLVLKERN
jgi:KaiC/GvpD/RAD55 family RecA-like ATPase